MRDLREPVDCGRDNLCSIFGIDDALMIASVGMQAAGGAASNQASKKASKVAQESRDQNNALLGQNYNRSAELLSPSMVRGNNAGEAINALLGLPSAPSAGYNPLKGTGQQDFASYVDNNPDLAALFASGSGMASGRDKATFGQYHWDRYGKGESRSFTPTTASDQASAGPAQAPVDYQGAFDQYQNSTGHQFRLQSGSDAISSNRATSGLLKSGSTLKALTKYGQDVGTGDFNNYLSQLSGQQSAGLGSTNSLIGVGSGTVNGMMGQNDSAASAQANQYLTQGANTNALLTSLASAAGSMGSSFGAGAAPNNPALDWQRKGYVLTGSPRV